MAIHKCINESRISKLEGDIRVNNTSIDNLIKKLDSLAGEVRWLVRLAFGTLLSVLGYVFSILLKG